MTSQERPVVALRVAQFGLRALLTVPRTVRGRRHLASIAPGPVGLIGSQTGSMRCYRHGRTVRREAEGSQPATVLGDPFMTLGYAASRARERRPAYRSGLGDGPSPLVLPQPLTNLGRHQTSSVRHACLPTARRFLSSRAGPAGSRDAEANSLPSPPGSNPAPRPSTRREPHI